MVSDRIRVALIGYGFVGKNFHAPLIQAVPELRLTVVASSKAREVQADLPGVQVYADTGKVFRDPDIDLVVLASPNDTHLPLALGALNNGKHLVVDKPFTATLADALQIVDLAESRKLLVSVFQNRRWDSDFLHVQELIKSGKLGTVVHFESHMDRYRPEVQQRWREKPELGNGIWHDLGPHLIDGALRLFGMPETVIANIFNQRAGAVTNDWAHVVLSYRQLRVVLHCSMLAAAPTPRFVVHGTEGSWIKYGVDQQEPQLLRGLRPGDHGFGDDMRMGSFYEGASGRETQLQGPAGDYTRYYAEISASLLHGASNPVPTSQALDVMRILELSLQSSATGKAINLIGRQGQVSTR